jgi:hypothetical protein
VASYDEIHRVEEFERGQISRPVSKSTKITEARTDGVLKLRSRSDRFRNYGSPSRLVTREQLSGVCAICVFDLRAYAAAHQAV